MTKQPWMKFYPSDWRSDPKLRVCSAAARGLWIDMLCLMHEAEPYGHLLVNGLPLTPKKLAPLVGMGEQDVCDYLTELAEAGVYSVEDDTIYSRRMKRDAEKAAANRANGSKGGNPNLPPTDNPPVNPEDKAQRPDARSQNLDLKEEGARAPRSQGKDRKRATRFPEGLSANRESQIAAGLSESVGAIEFTKFKNHSLERGRTCVDWAAAERNWYIKAAEYRGIEPPAKPSEVPLSGYYAPFDSPELEAWTKHEMVSGKKYPRDKRGGWRFPTRWPPETKDNAA